MSMDEITSSSSTTEGTGNVDDIEYDAFLARLRARYNLNTDEGNRPVFVVRTPDLFDAWLAGFPADQKQYHNCHSCHSFLKHYGALAVITEEGRVVPAVWNPEDAPWAYRPSVQLVHDLVAKGTVISPFYSSVPVWGAPETGIWRHMALVPNPKSLHPTNGLLAASQKTAEKMEDFNNLSRALSDYNLFSLQSAVKLLEGEHLYRSAKVLGAATWLLNMKQMQSETTNTMLRRNKLWLAVAEAPPGFCHPRSSMIGTLLDDLQSGSSFDVCARRFAEKMSPLKYQRPQAAPSAGNVAQAEKTFEKLGLARALERRFARLEDLKPFWVPRQQKAAEPWKGIFGHLKPKDLAEVQPMVTPIESITWEKFARVVLPNAEEIHCVVPSHGRFVALVTATHLDAPPIIQWDEPEARNPVTWYVYHRGSRSTAWNLSAGSRVRVPMIVLQPNMWAGEGKHTHHGKGAIFILEGAYDKGAPSLCLFPEFLRSELHSVRATIEAHSKSQKLAGVEEATACGLRLQQDSGLPGATGGYDKGLGAVVEVRVGIHTSRYNIDRLD